MLGHDFEKGLALNTEEQDDAELLNVARALVLWGPDSLSVLPLHRDFPSLPDHLHDLPETSEKLWALLIDLMGDPAGARSRTGSCRFNNFLHLPQRRFSAVELGPWFRWRHQSPARTKIAVPRGVPEGGMEMIVDLLYRTSEVATSLLSPVFSW